MTAEERALNCHDSFPCGDNHSGQEEVRLIAVAISEAVADEQKKHAEALKLAKWDAMQLRMRLDAVIDGKPGKPHK